MSRRFYYYSFDVRISVAVKRRRSGVFCLSVYRAGRIRRFGSHCCVDRLNVAARRAGEFRIRRAVIVSPYEYGFAVFMSRRFYYYSFDVRISNAAEQCRSGIFCFSVYRTGRICRFDSHGCVDRLNVAASRAGEFRIRCAVIVSPHEYGFAVRMSGRVYVCARFQKYTAETAVFVTRITGVGAVRLNGAAYLRFVVIAADRNGTGRYGRENFFFVIIEKSRKSRAYLERTLLRVFAYVKRHRCDHAVNGDVGTVLYKHVDARRAVRRYA